jgi:iron complex outermembrane receptor protein
MSNSVNLVSIRRPARRLMTSAAVLALLSPVQALAQEDAYGIEIITVTAQKRTESVQDVPIAITAYSEAGLAARGIDGLGDLAQNTPSLGFGNYSDLKLSPIALRGISASSGSAGQDPAVGVYVDEVFMGGGVGANIDMFDVERAEVLRGPQGTLFGRNTVGGVISITTKKPTDEFEGYVMGGYGDYDAINLRGAVSGPIIEDKLLARISAQYEDRDGFTRNEIDGTRGDDSHTWNLRGQLLMRPTENAEFILTGEYRKVNQRSKYFETLAYDTDQLLPQLLEMFELPLNTDPFDRRVYSDLATKETLKAWAVSFNANIDFGGVDFTSITSYREHEYDNIGDTDMSPLRWLYDGDPEDVWRFSQELRLSSKGDTALSWIAGLYYFHQTSRNLSFVRLGEDLAELLEVPAMDIGSDADMKLDSYAAYASLSYKITDQLETTLGGRFTYEKKSILYSQFDPLALLGGQVDGLRGKDNWKAFTPSFNIRYHFNPSAMAYATVSRGFKSGGFNDALGDANGISYDPEYIWNYEIGAKMSLLENRLRVNVAAFAMEWTDIQISSDDPNTLPFDPRTSNAGKAHSRGVELEVTAVPIPALELGFNLALTDAAYDEGTVPTAPGSPEIPLADLPRAPETRFGVNAQYTVPIGDLSLTLRGDYLYERGTDLLPIKDPAGRVGTVGLLNGRITLAGEEDRWSIALWGKNLTDKTYKTRLFDLSNQTLVGQQLIVLGAPRTFGVEARFNF